jgi:hypothetical protein
MMNVKDNFYMYMNEGADSVEFCYYRTEHFFLSKYQFTLLVGKNRFVCGNRVQPIRFIELMTCIPKL